MWLASALLQWGAALSPPGSFATDHGWLSRLPGLAALYPAFSGWRVLAQRLVAAGASLQEWVGGWPPLLHLAAMMGRDGCREEAHFQLLEALVELGASGADTDADGRTALDVLLLSLYSALPTARGGAEQPWGGAEQPPGIDPEASCACSLAYSRKAACWLAGWLAG